MPTPTKPAGYTMPTRTTIRPGLPRPKVTNLSTSATTVATAHAGCSGRRNIRRCWKLSARPPARGALSEFGQDVLRRVERACSDGEGRAGDLTPLGAEQHYGIAERMFESYPEVFRGQRACRRTIDRRGTLRAEHGGILRPAAEDEPGTGNHADGQQPHDPLPELFQHGGKPRAAPEYLNLLKSESWIEAEEGFRESRMHPERLMARLFAGGKVPADIDQREP